MRTRTVKYEKDPEYEPNAACCSERVEHRLPAELFCHDAAYGVAQNQPELLP